MTSTSALLAPGVGLHETHDGHVLTTAAGEVHAVHLDAADATALLDGLAAGRVPDDGVPAAAFAALAAAGHAVGPAPVVAVADRPADAAHAHLADALRAALDRLGARTAGTPGSPDPAPAVRVRVGVPVGPAPAPDSAPDPIPLVEAWLVDGHLLVAPPAVPARDLAARWRAAAVRRTAVTDPAVQPREGGRGVASAHAVPGPLATEVAAHALALEVLRRAGALPAAAVPGPRGAYLATVVDLRTAEVTRRPVLPVPPAPR